MKTLKFIYKETVIHFEMNPNDRNLFINATEMSKIFGKQVNEFTSNSNTKALTNQCIKNGNSRFISIKSVDDLIISRQKSGTFMHRILALKFAAWLDPEFELWVFSKIDEITFGHYHKHWEAHALQEEIKQKMVLLREKLKEEPTQEDVLKYFGYEQEIKETRKAKTKAIRNQLSLFTNYSDAH